MGKVPRDTVIKMATALQRAVAMYFLLVQHSRGETDLTEEQLASVVDGVCEEAGRALTDARRCGLVEAVPMGGRHARAHRRVVRAAGEAVH